MKGERIKVIHEDRTSSFVYGRDSTFFMYSICGQSEEQRRSYVNNMRIMLKRRWSLSYKVMQVEIPDCCKEFLIIRRDRSQKRNVGFSATWTDDDLYQIKKREGNITVGLTAPDERELPIPELLVLNGGKLLDHLELKKQQFNPGQYVPIELRLVRPTELPDSIDSDVDLIIDGADFLLSTTTLHSQELNTSGR